MVAQVAMERAVFNAKWMRFSKQMTLLVCIAFPFLVFAASRIQNKTAEIAQWLPDDSPERQQYGQFLKLFGNDLFLVVSWEGCDLDDPRVEQFKTAITKRADATDPGLITSVVDSQQMVDELVYGRAGLTMAQARNRLEGAFLGSDGQTLFWIQLATDSKASNTRVIELALDVLTNEIGIDPSIIHLAGSAYHATAVDESSSNSARYLLLPASLMAIGVAWLFIGQIRLAGIVFGIAAIGQITAIALVVLTGGTLNAVTIVMPTLIFMLTTSAAVHLVNYYCEARDSGDPEPALAAIAAGATPCLLASLTTVIGLSSLAISKLAPVREFGLYAGTALVLATLILLSTFAFLVSTLSKRKAKDPPVSRTSIRSRAELIGSRLAKLIIQHAGVVVLISVVTILAGALGVNRLRSTVDLIKMFPADAKVVKDFHWIEDQIAPLLSVEIVVEIPKTGIDDVLERLRIVRGFQETIAGVYNVKSVTSAVTFLPPLPNRRSSLRNTSRKSVFRTEFEQEKHRLVENGLLAERGEIEFWRISANVAAIEQDERPIVEDIRDACLPFVEKLADKNVSLAYTGLSPVIHEAKNLLFRDLLVSFMLAFALITPVMMWILRSIPGGVVGDDSKYCAGRCGLWRNGLATRFPLTLPVS